MDETDAPLRIRTKKSQARFRRVRNPDGPDYGVGNFLLILEVTAVTADVYIPISIASGKKPMGFMYQIEGSGPGDIVTATISCHGEMVSQVTWGTILYANIPKGQTAAFRILVAIEGKVGKTYTIAITKMNYRLDPSDARYQKLTTNISSRTLLFT